MKIVESPFGARWDLDCPAETDIVLAVDSSGNSRIRLPHQLYVRDFSSEWSFRPMRGLAPWQQIAESKP